MKKEYTPQQLAFRKAFIGEAMGDLELSKKLAGYSEGSSLGEIVNSLKEEIIEDTLTLLATKAPKAVGKLVGLLDDPNQGGAANLLKAVSQILDRAGVVSRSIDVSVKVPSGGIFILPAKEVMRNENKNEDEEE